VTAPATNEAIRRPGETLADLAYERLETLIVACELRPGSALSINELQVQTGLGRTPTHQAVTRLAADTLVIVRPRHGLLIAPIDLARERMLLHLRRDLERFVIRLAAERSGPRQRNQFQHLIRQLANPPHPLTVNEFNVIDRRIDSLIIAAAGEPFLEHTLRPLHTIFRRIGWLYHKRVARGEELEETVRPHLQIMEAVAARQPEAAVIASDRLIDFAGTMLDRLEREADPAWLDCTQDAGAP
jgi:DNA-binding GntR family transcriptional regulator